jgi:methyl-accepting chemotaxis protein
MKKKSLQARLLRAFIPVFVISFLVLSFTSYYLSQKSLSKNTRETAIAVSSRYADQIRSCMDSISNYLEIISGMEVIKAGEDRAQIVSILSGVFDKIGMFDVLFFVWPDGSAIRSVNTSFNAGEREYFKKVLTTGESYVSDVMISSSSGKPSVVVCEPVMDNGRLVGMLGATYNLERLGPILDSVKFKDSGYGFIVDRNGLVISDARHPSVVGKLNISEKKVSPEAGLSSRELDDKLLKFFRDTSSTWSGEIFGDFSFEGRELEGVFSPISLQGGQHWAVVVAAPLSEVRSDLTALSRIMLLLSAVFIVAGLIFVVTISRRVVAPIVLIRDECMVLASGDLREREVKVYSGDETSQLAEGFLSMKNSLTSLIKQVKYQAEILAASSETVTAGSQSCANAAGEVSRAMAKISTGAKNQAHSTENVLNIAHNISDTAQEVLNVTRQVNEIASSATREVKEGQASVDGAMSQMLEIGRGSSGLQKAITDLSEGSREISEIVNLISSVAQQTNLLALNAAIEASRAGDHGKGFAVVADEVRKLAESSKNATRQISELISKNQSNMEQAVEAARSGERGVAAGIEAVSTTGRIFSEIAASIVSLSDQIADVSSSIEKIAAGNQELVASISEIEKISKDNLNEVDHASSGSEHQAASTQQIASSSQNLAALAAELREDTASFVI